MIGDGNRLGDVLSGIGVVLGTLLVIGVIAAMFAGFVLADDEVRNRRYVAADECVTVLPVSCSHHPRWMLWINDVFDGGGWVEVTEASYDRCHVGDKCDWTEVGGYRP